MTGRRALLFAVAGAGVPTGTAMAQAEVLPVPPGRRLDFRIMRKGSQIGHHTSKFELAGDTMTMQADTEIVVRLLGIAVFRFTHAVTERWQGGRFLALETRTNDDGTPYTVSARREQAGLIVSGSAQPRFVAPPDAIPMTHWNRAEVGMPKINPQKGNILRPAVTDRGVAQTPSTSCGSMAAQQYRYDGDAMLDVWFDTAGTWAALQFLGSDQSVITLERC